MAYWSQLAQDDLDDLRAEGLVPTDRDVVRLHLVACRITDGQETTGANFPRWAIAGGSVFHQPTLAAIFWYKYAETFAEDEDTTDFMLAFACKHGREQKYLDNLRDPDEIQRALGLFIASLTCTRAELDRALLFVISGNGNAEAEKTELEKRAEEKRGTDETDDDRQQYEAIIASVAAVSGLSLDDIMSSTSSRLLNIIYSANVVAGCKMSGQSKKAHAKYLATFESIARRLRAEKNAAPCP